MGAEIRRIAQRKQFVPCRIVLNQLTSIFNEKDLAVRGCLRPLLDGLNDAVGMLADDRLRAFREQGGRLPLGNVVASWYDIRIDASGASELHRHRYGFARIGRQDNFALGVHADSS